MTKIFPLYRSLTHQLHSLSCNNAEGKNVCFHDMHHLFGVVLVENKTFGVNVGVVNKQIDSVIMIADPFEDAFDLCLVLNVAYERNKLALHAEHCSLQILRENAKFRKLFCILSGLKIASELTNRRTVPFSLANAITFIPFSTSSVQIAKPTGDDAPKVVSL